MAVTLTSTQLAYRMRLIADTEEVLAEPQLTVVSGILAAATALVQKYAPGAPDAIHNEAVTRLAGFLFDTPPSGSRQWQNPMQQSGATAILSAYRVLRAVAIETDGRDNMGILKFHARADVLIETSSVWTRTTIRKPSGDWWVYTIAAGETVSPAHWMPGDSLEPVLVGDFVSTLEGYVIGCAASGEFLLAGPVGGETATLTVWAWEG